MAALPFFDVTRMFRERYLVNAPSKKRLQRVQHVGERRSTSSA
jgi:hypothetical protein